MEKRITERILAVVGVEQALVILVAAFSAWVFYKLFLGKLSQERHRIFATNFMSLGSSLAIATLVFGIYQFLLFFSESYSVAALLLPYFGFFNIILGSVLAVKILRVVANEYFFFNSMKAGVPLLLVNICSLILSLLIIAWILTYIFNVQLASLVATSAVLSIVLGLALQDTLGNLFAGISIQIDKPFEMGDWIELRKDSEKIAGQVKELTWRATVLLAMTDELITIPNRTIAQWQIVNFAAREKPFLRSQLFRIPFDANIAQVKQILLVLTKQIPEILQDPAPLALLIETTPSWVSLKIVYAVRDYGGQFVYGDRYLTLAIDGLTKAGIRLEADRLRIERKI